MKKTIALRTLVACLALLVGLLSIYGFTSNIALAKQTASVRADDVLAATKSSFTPLAIPLAADKPSPLVDYKLYDQDGVEIGYIEQTGQIVTTGGNLIRTDEDSQSVHYDAVDQQLVDSANKKMKIYYDSRMLKHTIESGSKQVITIKPDDEIFMTTIKDPNDGLVKTVYTTRKLIKPSIWTRINPFERSEYEEEFYDMNNRRIPSSWFVDHKHAPWYKKALLYTAPAYLIGLFKTYKPTTWVQVESVGTYADLRKDLSFAKHPWDKIEGVITEDSLEIYINPENGQLSDFYFGPLYNYKTGLPMIAKVNDQGQRQIITIPDGKLQTVENGRLMNALTETYLYQHGIEFYVHYIDTEEYGTLNAIAMRDAKTKQWKLPNGDSAEGIVRDGVVVGGKSPKISTLGDVFVSAVGGVGNLIKNIGNFGKDTAGTLSSVFSLIITVLILALLAVPVVLTVWLIKKVRGGKAA